MHLLSEFTLEQAHLLPSGTQLLDEHGTERDGLGPRLCRAHDRSRSPFLSCAPLMKPLVKGTAGALEVDAEASRPPPTKRSVRAGQATRPARPERAEHIGHLRRSAWSDSV